MDSILDTIKKTLGIESSYNGFDIEVLLGINTALMSLNQLGIGPTDCLVVVTSDETWDQLLLSATNIEAAKSYISLKTKLLFDPPAGSSVLEAYKREIVELEWRLAAQVEPDPIPEPPPDE